MVNAVEVVYADWKKTKCPNCQGKLVICSWWIPLPRMSFSEEYLNDPVYTRYELYCRRCDEKYFKNSYERLEELEK